MREVAARGYANDRVEALHLRDIGFVLFLLAAFAAAGLQMQVDRSIENFFTIPVVKYSPVLFSLASLAVFALTAGPLKMIPKLWVPWLAMLIFFGYALFGSLQTVTRFGGDVEHSYLGRALCIIPFFAACAFLQDERYLKIFRKTVIVLFVFLTFFFAVVAALFFSGKAFQNLTQILHEEVVLLLIPAMFAPLLPIVITGRIVIWFLALGSILATYIFTHKVTGLMLPMIWAGVVAISWFAYVADGKRHQARVAAMGLRFMVLIAGACAMFYAAVQLYEHRTSLRSTDVRDASFQMRLEQFVDSPLLGTGFIGSPLMEIGWLEVPSHSDVLDIMAFGGLFSLFLFLVVLGAGGWRFFWNWRDIWKRPENALHAALGVFAGGFLFMMMFNPIVGFPRQSFWFWVAMGFMISAPIFGADRQVREAAPRKGGSGRSRRRFA